MSDKLESFSKRVKKVIEKYAENKKCPSNLSFGYDCDGYADCDNCLIFDQCADEAELIAEKRYNNYLNRY